MSAIILYYTFGLFPPAPPHLLAHSPNF